MEFKDICLNGPEYKILKKISKNRFFVLAPENLQGTKNLIRLHLAEPYSGNDEVRRWVRLTEFGKRYLVYSRQARRDKLAPLIISALSLTVSVIALVKSFFFTE